MAAQSRSWGFWDIQFDGFSQLKSELTRMQTKAGNAKDTIEESFKRYGKHVGEIFSTEGAVTSTPWASLSYWRTQERGSSNPILDFEGGLKASATTFKSSSTSERRSSIGAAKVVGNQSGWISMSGSKVYLNNPWTNAMSGNKVPARPFWPFENMQMDIMAKPFEEWVDGWVTSKNT